MGIPLEVHVTQLAANSSAGSRAPLMGYGELAIALYAAPDLPYPERRRLDLQELAGFARQGSRRLGGADRVRVLHEELLRANRAHLHGDLDDAGYERRVWGLLERMADWEPDMRRFDQCVAYDFWRLGRQV